MAGGGAGSAPEKARRMLKFAASLRAASTTPSSRRRRPMSSMVRKAICAAVIFCAALGWSQAKLSVQWEELTAADFRSGIQQSQGVCVLPIGILEKHGPHLPLGNDLINVRYAVQHGVQQEYAIVFPEYYFGQIFEAK